MNKVRLFLGLIPVAIAMSGCYYDNEEELYPTGTDTTSVVTYQLTIQPMIAGNCAISGCHVTNGQSPDLSTYQGVFDNRSQVKARAVNGTPSPMPAAGLMSADNRNKLAKWIDSGAPNN